MALMDAGVPIKHMVSGIAMGLLQNKQGVFSKFYLTFLALKMHLA